MYSVGLDDAPCTLQNEIMTAQFTGRPVISRLTMAVLEDSGLVRRMGRRGNKKTETIRECYTEFY